MESSIVCSIIATNLLLSGDNALAIAMACQGLKTEHQRTCLLLGSTSAVIMQSFLTYVASMLLYIPYLKIAGGIALAWIAAKLVTSNKNTLIQSIECRDLRSTMLKIMIANTVMSFDNVLAVAVIADKNTLLMVLGLLISFPIVFGGTSIILNILDKYPCIMWIGSLFLGWTAGDIIASDDFVSHYLDLYSLNHIVIALLTAIIVVANGLLLNRNKANSPIGNRNISGKN